MFGHGGNPGKFESYRRFEVDFHNTSTLLVHPGTKTAACLHGESYTEIRIFIQARHVNACMCTCMDRVELSPGRVSSRDEIPHVNIRVGSQDLDT